MRVGLETEHVISATRRHTRQAENAQTDRNFRYMEYRNAHNFPLTSVGELIVKQSRLMWADHRLSHLQETRPTRLRRYVLGRVKIPLPSIPV